MHSRYGYKFQLYKKCSKNIEFILLKCANGEIFVWHSNVATLLGLTANRVLHCIYPLLKRNKFVIN